MSVRGPVRLLEVGPLGRRYQRLHPSVQRKLKVAVPYFALGVAVLVGTYFLSDTPDWTVFLPFAVLFVMLEMFTVEVNDRLMQSSSIMVVMTANRTGFATSCVPMIAASTPLAVPSST